MQSDEFVKLVSVRAEAHSREDTERVIKAVFETLRERIVHDTGDNIKAQLPHDLQHLWESGFIEHVAHKMAAPTRMDLSGFIGRVGDRMGTADTKKAEMATAAVFMTLRQAITPGAQESIRKELPEDIREFWSRHEPPEMPQESPASRTSTGHEQQAEQEGPPYEMEAPVTPTPQEQTGAWRSEAYCEVCGAPHEEAHAKHEIHTEEGWHHREVGTGGQPLEMEEEIPTGMTGRQKEEPAAHPPSEDRVEVVPPPGQHKAVAGPGNPEHYRSDPQMEEEIRQMLQESDEVEADKINVMVQAGNVTLRGHAKDQHERDEVGKIAAKALGVGTIFNEVTVEESQQGEMRPGEGI